jgi:hypothetical protein
VKIHLEIVDQGEGQTTHANGDQVLALYFQHTQAGKNGTKMFAAAIAGISEESEYDAFDPDGEFIDALIGDSNPRTEEASAMVGRLVDCRVSRGKDTGEGDYYREYEWSPVEQ